ncbi:MAG: bifunctional SulP family inorganic anion transporter/carbonic anhydrase [Leptospiraceae bacterium]|nr:bifunctional SulP family inorganic anion transporter/carbonic anhydrase [Leptospiraceae bacterium]
MYFLTKENLKKDIPIGFLIFLLSIPLNIGAAVAFGFSPTSGIISGIIGGVIVGFLSSSNISISAPASGLSAIFIFLLTYLNNHEAFFLALTLAGLFQVFFGMIRSGFIAAYFPSSVVKGFIVAIGIILILKQIPHAVGFDKDVEGDFSFFQMDGENTFSELIKIFNYFMPIPFLNFLFAMGVLFLWNKINQRHLKKIPAPIMVIFFGCIFNEIFKILYPALSIGKSHLINIPEISFLKYWNDLTLPDFNLMKNYQTWVVAFSISIITSIESLLVVEAIDKMDPKKRRPRPSKELIAQGVGNVFSGMLGGLPIANELLRSSANLEYENNSKLSAISQGILLFLGVQFFFSFLNLIPLSSFAAILVMMGYKLADISVFKEMYNKGQDQFIPFISTVLAIIFTDLLIGVLIGLFIAFFFVLRNNYRNPFTLERKKLLIGETLRLELTNQVTFLNKATIKGTLWHVPENSKVIIDASYSDFIDKDVLEVLEEFKDIIAPKKNIQLNLIGLKDRYELSDNIQFVNVISKEAQAKLHPDEILQILKSGNERFVNGIRTEKYYKHQVNATSDSQFPMVVVLSCVDSRTSPEIVFDAGLGDIVSIRIAGNVISEAILGSIEIACSKLGAKVIVVMGHSNCGAIKLALNSVTEGKISGITKRIFPAIEQTPKAESESAQDYTNAVSWLNVHNSVSEILAKSKYVRNNVLQGKIKIVSAFYDVETGVVKFES